MIIIRHIHHMLLADGYADVPTLGELRLVHSSACATSDGLLAPSTSVIFCRDYISESKALENSVAKVEGLTQADAHALVRDELSILHHQLEAGNAIGVADLGHLIKNADGKISFVDNNKSILNGWLNPLKINNTALKATEDEERTNLDTVVMEMRRRSLAKSLQRTASSAAVIAIFALITFIVSQLPGRYDEGANVASMGFENVICTSAGTTECLTASAPQASLVLLLNTPDDGTAPAKVRQTTQEKETAQAPGRYCLIVASLASESEAQKFIATHSTTDMPLSLLKNDGRCRVYALSAGDASELTAIARNIGVYDRYPSAWVCRR